MKRPNDGYYTFTTPKDAELLQLLGGQSSEDIALTAGQMQAIHKLYGFVPEKPHKKPPAPVKPTEPTEPTRPSGAYSPEYAAARRLYDSELRLYEAALERHANWEDPREFMQRGADRNAIRHARSDGMRMLAWIAGHLQPGDDPVKTLVRLAVDAGWDVDPEDIDWAEEDDLDLDVDP